MKKLRNVSVGILFSCMGINMRTNNLKCWEWLSLGSGITNKGGLGRRLLVFLLAVVSITNAHQCGSSWAKGSVCVQLVRPIRLALASTEQSDMCHFWATTARPFSTSAYASAV